MSPRAVPMSPADRRQAIIDAVRPLLIERGDRLTTRVIAEAAGIAEGTIFRVFPDKEALLHAVAADTLNPPDARERLQEAIAGVPDLPSKVRVVAEQMLRRSDQVVAVMMALRRHWMAQPGEHRAAHAAHADPAGRDVPQGPPPFVVEAHQALLERLTEVFEPHRDELAVSPERAALLLRTLVLGSRHPGMRAEDRLTAAEVADVLLGGIHRPVPDDRRPDPRGESC